MSLTTTVVQNEQRDAIVCQCLISSSTMAPGVQSICESVAAATPAEWGHCDLSWNSAIVFSFETMYRMKMIEK